MAMPESLSVADNLRDRIRARIKAARNEAGLSLRELAEAIGVAHNVAVARYESGIRQPDLETLDRIASATGKPLSWFIVEDASEGATCASPAEPEAREHAPPDKAPANTPIGQEPPGQQVSGPGDTQGLLAQLVAAQTAMMQAQARADERHAEMAAALGQMQTRLTTHGRDLARLHQEIRAQNRLNDAKYWPGYTEQPPSPDDGTEEVGA